MSTSMEFSEPRRSSEDREEILSEKVPAIFPGETIVDIPQSTFTSTHISLFPEFSGTWSRLPDSGEQQQFLAGSDATITVIGPDGPVVKFGHQQTYTYTMAIRAGDVVGVEPDAGRWFFLRPGVEWYRIFIPSQFRFNAPAPAPIGTGLPPTA